MSATEKGAVIVWEARSLSLQAKMICAASSGVNQIHLNPVGNGSFIGIVVDLSRQYNRKSVVVSNGGRYLQFPLIQNRLVRFGVAMSNILLFPGAASFWILQP